MKYKFILFDLDGTLFDYDKAEAMALQKTFEQFAIRYDPFFLMQYKRLNEMIWHEYERGEISQKKLRTRRFELLSNAIGIDYDTDKFSVQYLTNISDRADLIDGSEDVIKSLYNRFSLVLITNGLKDVQWSRITKSTIGDYFMDVIISEEVGYAKPDTKLFDFAFQRINNPKKDEVLIVGDSLTSDIAGGNNYGIDTCWFNRSKEENNTDITARYEINDLKEILNILDVS